MTVQVSLLPCNQFDHFYRGGDRIGALRKGPGGPRRPEEWLGSTTARFGQAPNGYTTLPDGTLLVEAIDADPIAWLGEEHVARYGSSIEVLVKLLDLGQRLPVHLHPNRAFAKEHLGLAHGKTEAWYVIDAPAGAKVGVGFAEDMTYEGVREWVSNRDSEALLASLRTREVKPGDAMLVPAGMPHTVQDGVFVLELQEPTDLSILLEWADFAVDGEKDGHLDLGFETALKAVDTTGVSDSDLDRLVVSAESLRGSGLHSVLPAQADPYFRAQRVVPAGGVVQVDPGFSVTVILEGRGILTTGLGAMEVTRGDVALIPYAAGTWSLEGDAVAVACRPPAADAPEGAV